MHKGCLFIHHDAYQQYMAHLQALFASLESPIGYYEEAVAATG